jgi:predicted alpha/beta superfamily hydrolase
MRFCIACAVLAGCHAPDHPAITGRVVEERFPSTNVADTYRILIRLPPGYDANSSDTFRVIYQLDAVLAGFNEFEVTAGFVSDLEQQGMVPPAIVVGIGYYGQDHRTRDFSFPVAQPDQRSVFAGEYSYGAEAFRAFIRDELIPHIDSTFRSDRRPRTLVGHSLGGMFVLHWLCHYAADDPFDKLIAASPTLDYENGALFDEEKQLASRTDTLPLKLYMAIGAVEQTILNVYFDAMTARLRAYRQLDFKAMRYEGTDHAGDVDAAFPDGLTFVERP